jgi:HlyD family secretion protein
VKRTPVLASVLVAALAAGAAAYFHLSKRDAAGAGGGYVTASVDRGDIVATVLATGTVNPVTTVQVGTYVSGPIIALDVDFNSPVKKGQRVAKIDPAAFVVKVQIAEANLANARARVAQARADLELKRLTLERYRQLREKDFISQNDVDTARSGYDQATAQLALARAGVKQAEAQLEEARINLAYTDITSPVDGVVVSRSVDVGQTVAASFQTPTLFEIAQDLTKMQVNANVSESDIGTVAEGQAATFTVDAYPGREFGGAVIQVRNAPITVSNVVTYDVVIGVDNSDLVLKPGMTATVTIVTERRDGVLRLPIRALTFAPSDDRQSRGEDDGEVVWRLAAGEKLERVGVTTGLRDEEFAELVSGDLRADDEVAVALRGNAPERSAPVIPGMPRRR